MREALSIYRRNFKPSRFLNEPYVIACINVIAADSNEEAEFILSTTEQVYIDIYTNNLSQLIAPVKNFRETLSPSELNIINHRLGYTIHGDKTSIRRGLTELQDVFQVDEVIALENIYDTAKEIRSYEILKEVYDELNQ